MVNCITNKICEQLNRYINVTLVTIKKYQIKNNGHEGLMTGLIMVAEITLTWQPGSMLEMINFCE